MRIIRDFQSCPPACQGAVIALGNFDGVHLGHRAIIKEAVALAKRYGVPAAVMTFEPHPREFFAKARGAEPEPLRLTSFYSKVSRLRESGIDQLFLMRFNAQTASLSAEAFVGTILQRDLKAKHIVTGYNFAFGKGRGGDTAFLAEASKRLGFGFSSCDAVHDANGNAISSSAIRTLLAAGDIAQASALLGRPYRIEGKVRHGQKRGRELGFPTANIPMKKLFSPRYGVYAVRFSTQSDPHTHYTGVANLGVKPTFALREPMLEVHGFDMSKDLYHSCAMSRSSKASMRSKPRSQRIASRPEDCYSL